MTRRLQAGQEAIELLDRAGFNIHTYDLDAEREDATVDVQAQLSVEELTRPLQALEDDSNDDPEPDKGAGFALGLFTGLIAANNTSSGCGCADGSP